MPQNEFTGAIGAVMASHFKAQAALMTAVLSTLVRHKIIPADAIEDDILGSLESIIEAARTNTATEADRLDIDALDQLTGLMRQHLFGSEDTEEAEH